MEAVWPDERTREWGKWSGKSLAGQTGNRFCWVLRGSRAESWGHVASPEHILAEWNIFVVDDFYEKMPEEAA